MLIEGLPLWLAQTNCWIVAPDGPGGECVLVDAPPDPAAIVERLRHHDLRVAALFNTHGHIDHIGGVGHLMLMMQAGPMDSPDVIKSLTLFAKEVYPRLKELSPVKVSA